MGQASEVLESINRQEIKITNVSPPLQRLDTLMDIYEGLISLGYTTQLQGETVAVFLGSKENPFVVTLSISNANELVVTCQIGNASQIFENNGPDFAVAALLKNIEIRPFSFGIIEGGDDSTNLDDIIVLINSVPLGDFSLAELKFLIKSLERAILASSEVIYIAFSK